MLTSSSIYTWGVERPRRDSQKGCDLMELLTWRSMVWQYLSQLFHGGQSQLEAKEMEKTVANSEDASVFLLSCHQQREHTDCEGESVCYITEIYLQKEQAKSLSTTDAKLWSCYFRLFLEQLCTFCTALAVWKLELEGTLQKPLKLQNQFRNLEHCCPSGHSF